MRVERLVESRPSLLELTLEEVEGLRAAGKRLASDKTWWGHTEETQKKDRSVITCRPDAEGKYRVTVHNAVGIVSTGDLQLVVGPKIPTEHLLYLMSKSGRFPRVDEQRGVGKKAQHFWELVAQWFVSGAEHVLRRDLLRDYSSTRDFTSAKRGRLNVLPTARAYYSGRIGFDCTFDEFSTDTPLNRVLKAASRVVARSAAIDRAIRRRSAAVMARMEDVGPLRHSDLRSEVDRRTGHYRDALVLAKHVIRWHGRTLDAGRSPTWTFLIRTPELVEDGLRNVLSDGLQDLCAVEKGYTKADGSNVSFEPDLLFGDSAAVGDVKYKLQGADWNRPDLYQIIAFGTAFKTERGAVFGFADPSRDSLPTVSVGGQIVQWIPWRADPDIEPDQAAASVLERAREWLGAVRVAPLEWSA